MEKVPTGIEGLDELLGGGIPKKNTVLVCGGPGTGKTTLCMQFLYGGLAKGEKGLFLTLEEDPGQIIENVKSAYDWPKLAEAVEKKEIVVTCVEQFNFEHFMDVVQDFVVDGSFSRVVIDSSTLLKIYFNKPIEFRKNMVNLATFLKKFNCTTLITAEFASMERGGAKFDLEHFVTDGIIFIYNFVEGNVRVRALEVVKMRATEHSSKLVPFKMTKKGVVVFPTQEIFKQVR